MHKPKFQIILSYSEIDQQYIAEVPDVPRCKGYGWSYAAALASVEQSIENYRKDIEHYLKTNPPPPLSPEVQGARSRAMQILRSKYGNKTVREFWAQLGGGCDEAVFISALTGTGQREVRIQLALAVDMLPSKLWPHRSFTTRKRDDQAYLRQKMNLPLSAESDKILELSVPSEARA